MLHSIEETIRHWSFQVRYMYNTLSSVSFSCSTDALRQTGRGKE